MSLDVRLMAQYRVRDIAQYFSTQAQDVELVLKQSGASALREVVGRMEAAEIVGGKPEQIIGRVQPQWQAALDGVQSGIRKSPNLSAGPDAVQAPEALKAVYAEVEKVRQDKAQAAEQAAAAIPARLCLPPAGSGLHAHESRGLQNRNRRGSTGRVRAFLGGTARATRKRRRPHPDHACTRPLWSTYSAMSAKLWPTTVMAGRFICLWKKPRRPPVHPPVRRCRPTAKS